MRTLFLNPPSYDDFDGGAGARYQAKREVWSFWYPTWLSYPAGMLPGARLLDAPPEHMTIGQVVDVARDYDHVVIHTSTPSFRADVRTAQALKAAAKLGFAPKVVDMSDLTLAQAAATENLLIVDSTWGARDPTPYEP